MPRLNRSLRHRSRSQNPGEKVRVASSLGPAIEIPVSLGLTYPGQRQELQLRGRVTTAAAVDEIVVLRDGTTVFGVHCNPQATAAQHRQGFACNLIRPAAQAGEPWRFDIIARDRNGAVARAAFCIADEDTTCARVIDGPSAPDMVADDPPPPMILYVEQATLDQHKRIFLQGWALALDAVQAVRVLGEAGPLGHATLGHARQDVAGWRPEYPNAARAGFELSMHLPAAKPPDALWIEAETTTGHRLELVVPLERIIHSRSPGPAVSPVPLPPDPRRDIRLFCDEAELSADGQLRVIGWATCATGISEIAVHLLDGSDLGEAEFGLPRRDVGDEYVTIPMARYSGFRLVRPVPEDLDNPELLIIARNGLGDTRELQVTVHRSEPMAPPEPPPVAEAASDGFRLVIDSPAITNGMIREPVSGRLTIDGWALGRAGVAGIEVMLDGQRLGKVHYGLARQDVAHAFRDWPNAVRSGFAFHCPPRLLRNGMHEMELRVRGVNGEALSRTFGFEVRKTDDTRERVAIRNRISRTEVDFYTQALVRLGSPPAFLMILRLARQPEPLSLGRTLESLRRQIVCDWRLVIVVPNVAVAKAASRALAATPPDLMWRIEVLLGRAVWPHAGSKPELIGFLGPGDELGCDALAEVALAQGLTPQAELFYADESRISPVSREREAFFKPDFSPELLLATNYIGRPVFATPRLIDRTGATPESLLALGEYDLLLRCAEQATTVTHVPKLLCERGPELPDQIELDGQALAVAVLRRGISAEILPGPVPGNWRLRRTTSPHGIISIIIPTCAAGGHIETCIRGLRERTAYRNVEIICVENIPEAQAHWRHWLHGNADTVLATTGPFNWAAANNRAAAIACGEYLLFLNDDIEIEQQDWLDAMLEHAARPEVGVVGLRLLYPDRSVQHAGMFLAGFGTGRHAFRLATEDDPGYFGLARTQREVSAVTGACMLMRRSHFNELGGFDEAYRIINNDVDFCLRTIEIGRSVMYTPHATLIHHEQASRGELPETSNNQRFANRWRTRFAKGDPFHNENLSRQHDDFRPNEEPVHVVHGSQKPFDAEIGRILVVKVDHIGDFMTALPAIRRLKSRFQAASIHVLASPATAGFAALEPAIDGTIPFEFFHARSALGQKTIDADGLEELRRHLAPFRFDLAIDLRKHPETRPLLLASGARYLAGFDYAGQFTWLDLALEWEGDPGLQPKRYHVSDDLLHLVDVIAASASPQPAVVASDVLVNLRNIWPLPHRLDSLFTRPVVCVHPGAGNEMKQWPTEHFVALIDLIVHECQVNVLLIGGPGEAEIGERILPVVTHANAVCSVIDEIPLEGLPALLSRCALFVGNDSGPKHIAAGVGIPTIGIHSGTVDPTEWGPIGPNAVAVARQMSCSPCYLNRPADCVRELACIRQIEPRVVFGLCRQMLGRT